VSLDDEVKFNGMIIKPEHKRYILLNKPKDYITTLKDPNARHTVMDLIEGACKERVYPVGRLDMYSEGLLFLTNDGDFANRVMHPSHEVSKVYHTWVTGENIEKAVRRLRRPMDIDGVTVQAKGVDIVQGYPDRAQLSVTIGEGRNRQVRKMCEQAGLKVTRLVRVEEGGVELGSLKTGTWRRLTPGEITKLLGKK
jgi:23S rRNA pseudouridine2605 synthase